MQLVSIDRWMEMTWPNPEDRPTKRTVWAWIGARVLPSVKMRGRVYMNTELADKALEGLARGIKN